MRITAEQIRTAQAAEHSRAEVVPDDRLLDDLRAISLLGAVRLQRQDAVTEADLYDENGVPG